MNTTSHLHATRRHYGVFQYIHQVNPVFSLFNCEKNVQFFDPLLNASLYATSIANHRTFLILHQPISEARGMTIASMVSTKLTLLWTSLLSDQP